ncbi:MAG: ABC transporter ATP-binding protein [Desulfurococcales archaeon]|nr:ABC transporter ATP-binding protein [Desulfurococcales archaeon]
MAGEKKEALLEIRDLKVNYKVYKGTLKVLNGVELRVGKGERIGLVGESGSGKTTTLKSILRILPYNASIEDGRILYKGIDLLRADERVLNEVRRREIAMIFQDPMAALNPVFKVRDQLYDIIKESARGKLAKEEIEEIAYRLLKEVRLPDVERVMDSYPFQLSGGMRQRVVIAMALASARELLLADEPTTNLDVTIQDQILRLLADLTMKRNLSVILVSHALGMVRKMTDRTYVMYAGDIVEEGDSGEIFENPLHPYTQLLVETAPKLTGNWNPRGVPGRIPDYLNPPPGCRFHTRCPFAEQICREKKPPMIAVEGGKRVRCWLYYKR